MSFFISDALAAAPAGSPGSGFGSIIMLAGFILIFYFLLWRPQSKRAKDHRNLVSNLSMDDEIVTNGGLLGKITKVSDDYIHLNVAEGVAVTIQKSAVSAVLPKGTMVAI